MLENWKRRHWPLDTCKLEQQENLTSAQPLLMRDMRAAFVVLSIGMSVATLTLIAEIIFAFLSRLRSKIDV